MEQRRACDASLTKQATRKASRQVTPELEYTKGLGRSADDQYVIRTFGTILSVLMFVALAYPADPGYVLHKRVSEVRLTLVATDASGRPWPGLTATSVAVADEGRAVGNFQLRTADDLPLRVGILLDLSDSTVQSWSMIRPSLAGSMGDLMRSGDKLLVTSFASKMVGQTLLAQAQDLTSSLPSSTGGLTALYDAIYNDCENSFFGEELEPRRSAILLFSDGEDNLSYHGFSDALSAAQQAGIAIYTIAMHKTKVRTRGDDVLQQLAYSTGGKDFIVRDHKGLESAL